MDLKSHEQVYEPHEDSELIKKHISQYAKGQVLDMGTGSGILALEASEYAEKVIAVDLNPYAVKLAKRNCKNAENIVVKQSYLFDNVQRQFDLITFNAPYLPEDDREPDDDLRYALSGGKKGYETTLEFLEGVNEHLADNGVVLLLISSLTHPSIVEEHIKKQGFDFEVIDSLKLSFEELFVYKLMKSDLLLQLMKLGVTDIEYLAKGHRGIIYTGMYKKKKVAIKSVSPHSGNKHSIENEAKMLYILNEKHIGPRVVLTKKNLIMYQYVDGQVITEFFKTASKNEIVDVLVTVYKQLRVMDTLHINKEEMTNPYKHIFVTSERNVVMIDFERAHKTINVKNVTQFTQYISSALVVELLNAKGITYDKEKLIELSREYKQNYGQTEFLNLVEYIKNN